MEPAVTFLLPCAIALLVLMAALYLYKASRQLRDAITQAKKPGDESFFTKQISLMDHRQVKQVIQLMSKRNGLLVAAFCMALPLFSVAQDGARPPLFSQTGILITIALLLIPVLAAVALLIGRVKKEIYRYRTAGNNQKAQALAAYLQQQPVEKITQVLRHQQQAAGYSLTHNELSGVAEADDSRGLLRVNEEAGLPFVALKRKAAQRTAVDPRMGRLVLWYLITATCWLLAGTTIGEYLGVKFVAPDADHLSWLSFGRLRPVHTNAVFWGWASLGMIGLGYYVVPRVGNGKIFSFKLGWYSLILINATVVIGSITLMAGINNGGGEYREYIWPVMLPFAVALALTLYNFLRTIARRKTKEIYIANWYIVAALMFCLVIAITAYWPSWQNGLGETIIQGYYMHQGVGMWFMLFTLGLVYYYLPQQLNKPIYSYSLGILAFWTQILFYTLIGTHHFVFSSIPWWLQTVAIFGSAGMVIPVIAGTTNFLMTFKNGWYKLNDSYTLPFFLVGTIFYFTGSLQGTAEAFRSTNLIWHFTDFTVAHSHLTMYGIISFFLWACIYTIVPRFTQQEAPQVTVGAHFWLALIGLLFYTVPLMYGSTLRGLLWMEGKPFIDSVVMMKPHWLWRAIGGSLMWTSHLFFAYNLYKMMPARNVTDVNEKLIQVLQERLGTDEKTSNQ